MSTFKGDVIDAANFVELTEISSPATPASTKARLYCKSDGRAYVKNDAGTEHDLVGGAVATVVLTGQTGSISSTDLVTGQAGLYQASVYLLNTTPGSAGTLNATISAFDGVNTRNYSPAADISLSLGGNSSGSAILYSSGTVSYATTVTGASGSPQYSIRISLEKLITG